MKFDNNNFELFLFTTDTSIAGKCLAAGVNAIIIDWENKGKDKRQNGYGTQINYDTSEDLVNMRNSISGKIICRINKYDPEYSAEEIDLAISCGADEIFLPMAEDKEEVCRTIDLVKDRCKLGILIETDNAVKNAINFTSLPLSRIYVGLNDLQISRQATNMFLPLVDGTVKNIKTLFNDIPVGVGGITHPNEGMPIPAKILIQQYINLNMNFSFLRRAFLNDLKKYGANILIGDIRKHLEQAKQTPSAAANEQLKSFLL